MQIKTSLLAALFAATTLSMHAQTAVPTPQSVAPGYTPPVETTTTSTGPAYRAPHAGTWDFYLTAGAWFFNDSTMTANNVWFERDHGTNIYADGKLKMSIDDSFSFGFGAGYNITEQLSAHAQFAYTSADYAATFNGTYVNGPDAGKPALGTVRGTSDISSGDLSIRYDLIKGKFRPFVQASVGFLYIDTGLVNGPYYFMPYYWNDYYGYDGYGYSYDVPTVDHTYFTLGATGGVRWDFSKYVFGQLSYTANWANTPHNWMLNQRVNLSIGWNY